VFWAALCLPQYLMRAKLGPAMACPVGFTP